MVPRTYTIIKHPNLGYGFIAGNDSPTIVKSIQPNGPSYNKLLPGDIIMNVNGINVENASREQIIKIIQLSDSQIEITVRQVVMKIFFETGSTKVLNYNHETTVGCLVEQLNSKLIEDSPHAQMIRRYFGIVLTMEVNQDQHGKIKTKQLYILDENDSISKLEQLSYAPSLRLIYRMIHPPTNVTALLGQDKKAFDYLYQQSCNDLKLNRFRPELEENISYKLATLHLLEHVYTHHSKEHRSSKDPKVYIDLVKDAPGLQYFMPNVLLDKMKDKKGKLLAGPFKKLKKRLKEELVSIFENCKLDSPSTPLSDQVKLLFLNELSQMPCYGNSERPPVRTSPSSLSSSIDQTSDSLSLIRLEDSASYNNLNNERLIEYPSVVNNSNDNNGITTSATINNGSSNNNKPDIITTPTNGMTNNNNNKMRHLSPSSLNNNNNNNSNNFHVPPNMNGTSGLVNRISALNDPKITFNNHQVPPHKQMEHQGSLFAEENIRSFKMPAFSVISLDESWRKSICPPPPPLPKGMEVFSTRVLTDREIEKFRTPPPPPRLLSSPTTFTAPTTTTNGF